MANNKWRVLDLSVVIPMYNEEESAAALLADVRDALDGQLNYELVVVNDGSTDGTEEILRGIQAKFPRLKIVKHLKNRGQSVAIISGVKYSIAPWIATLDGDGQNDPHDIPALFSHATGYDPFYDNLLITGIRKQRYDNWLRIISSRLANLIRQMLFRDGCPDAGSGLKIFPRRVFMDLPQFDHMHRFLPALVKRKDGVLINIPVNHRPRLSGQSKYGVWNRLWISIVDIFGVRWLLSRDVNVEVEVLSPVLVKTRRKFKISAPTHEENEDVMLSN